MNGAPGSWVSKVSAGENRSPEAMTKALRANFRHTA